MKICYYVLLFTFHLLLLTSTASGQVGSCEAGAAEAFLDVGNVRARIFNNGALFWNGEPSVYEVPKGGGANAIFASSIWVAGKIDGELRAAASRFSAREFWPGPLDSAGNPPVDCTTYDQLWEVNQDDLINYFENGDISDNLRNWPWELGAPVVDGDGNPNNYNLASGDAPELLGHQRFWWIMNDRGNVHESTSSEPIGLEIHASAFAFAYPFLIEKNTFYKYRLINKNIAPLTEAYFSFWPDVDLGNFDDDFVGSDSLLHLGYFYNADNDDEGGQGYGEAPPAIGFTFLDSAIADRDGLDNDRDGEIDEPSEKMGTSSSFSHQKGGSSTVGEPVQLTDYYNNMQARWKDGSTMKEGWNLGYVDNNWPDHLDQKTTLFSYSGDPVTASFWSENNLDGLGFVNEPSDRRLLISTGPFSINPRDTLEVSLAIVWARGKNNLDSITELKKNTRSVRDAAEAIFSPSNQFAVSSFLRNSPAPPPNHVLGFDQNFPNPFSQSTTIRYSLPQSMQVRLAVYDILGREVELLVEQRQEAGIYTIDFAAGNLPAGIYLARIELDHLRFTKRMMHIQ